MLSTSVPYIWSVHKTADHLQLSSGSCKVASLYGDTSGQIRSNCGASVGVKYNFQELKLVFNKCKKAIFTEAPTQPLNLKSIPDLIKTYKGIQFAPQSCGYIGRTVQEHTQWYWYTGILPHYTSSTMQYWYNISRWKTIPQRSKGPLYQAKKVKPDCGKGGL